MMSSCARPGSAKRSSPVVTSQRWGAASDAIEIEGDHHGVPPMATSQRWGAAADAVAIGVDHHDVLPVTASQRWGAASGPLEMKRDPSELIASGLTSLSPSEK